MDDDPQIRRVMRMTLTHAGYEVDDARTGEEAELKIRDQLPDLILLDMNMPGEGGLAACKRIRAGSDVPIIMLTVRNGEEDKVAALDAGADDFVTKPFSTPELLARMRAALRRSPTASDSGAQKVAWGNVEVDFAARSVYIGGKATRLTPKEFDLLRYLVFHPDRAIPHRELLQAVWGPDYGDELEYLRVFIRQLRQKVEPAPDKPRYILTEPWVGYRFQIPKSL